MGREASDDDQAGFCRICFEETVTAYSGSLVSPCRCSGSMKWVHQRCLFTWREQQLDNWDVCPTCKTQYDKQGPVLKKFRPKVPPSLGDRLRGGARFLIEYVVPLTMMLMVVSLWKYPPIDKELLKEAREQLYQGCFLVSTSKAKGSLFEQSVILMLWTKPGEQLQGQTTPIGLIINHPTEHPRHYHGIGGPVSPSSIIVLHKDHTATQSMPPASPVVGVPGLFWGGDPRDGSGVWFQGVAQWSPWQLERELLRGVFKVCNSSLEAALELGQHQSNSGPSVQRLPLWSRIWADHGEEWRQLEQQEALKRKLHRETLAYSMKGIVWRMWGWPEGRLPRPTEVFEPFV